MKEYYIAIPENLDIAERLKIYPPNFEFNIDFAHFVINYILKSSSYLSGNDNHYIEMGWDFLKFYNNNHRSHMRYLCEFVYGIANILWRRKYRDGRAYSYNLSPTYHKEPLKITRITDKKILKRLTKENFTVSNKLKKKYNFLIGYFEKQRFTIDFDNALIFCANEFKESKKYNDYLKHIYSTLNIKNNDYRLSYNPDTDGRVHTNLTRFPKKLRNFLKYDGKHLAEVDISASIPTFLYYLLSNLYNTNSSIDSIINNKDYNIHYMSTKKTVTIDIVEIQRFGELLLNGAFYETFIDDFHTIHLFEERLKQDQYYLDNVKKMFGYEFDGDMEDLRDVVKKNLLAMFNAKPAKYLCEEAVFNTYFPTILRFIKKFKSKKGKHNYFSYLMLQIESHFMLHITARELSKKYRRKIPVFTLHDCLITTEDYLDEVHKFMESTLEKELGFKPILKPFVYK